ncbi:MAG: S8 family serine peptidase, partial [Schleiferiaceae bacterium]|nr:S8 family serine peptidase [Schleiferiaceae bacterium]
MKELRRTNRQTTIALSYPSIEDNQKIVTSFFVLLLSFFSLTLFGQSTSPKDYVLISAKTNNASSPTGIILGSNTTINEGIAGSDGFLYGMSNVDLNGSVYSTMNVALGGNNDIRDDIYVSNLANANYNIISSSYSPQLGGDIYGNGNIYLNAGNVAGKVYQPVGKSYSGPAPANGIVNGPLTFNRFPDLPNVTVFSPTGTQDLSTDQTILPGSYKAILLGGGKKITFDGPGEYVFSKIANSGTSNTFKFDFKDQAIGFIKIHVHGDVDLGTMDIEITGGGEASRIIMEVHGNGSTNGGNSVILDGGSAGQATSKWKGTIYATQGSIKVGGTFNSFGSIFGSTGTAYPTVIDGALFANGRINLTSKVTINHIAFNECTPTFTLDAGLDDSLSCSTTSIFLQGQANILGTYLWSTDTGNIVSGAHTKTPEVNKAGAYYFEVFDANNCSLIDTVIIYKKECIVPYYPPPSGGKTSELIGSELTSLSNNSTYIDSLEYIFFSRQDSVFIEVISIDGQTATLLALLQTTPYGLTNIIDNGPGSLIISGLFPINNLTKLDSLPHLINYVRPLYPPLVNSGLISSQGDRAMRSNLARSGFNVDGEGVKVGVLSDSYNSLAGNPAATDIANQDLPGVSNPINDSPVNVIEEYPYGPRLDEGRAMLQIIHDVAPKSELSFRTGFVSAGDMAQGINDLVQDSCDIIVDDITYITEPYFPAGVVSKAVNDAKNNGVTYFTSAGNFGEKSYASTFVPAQVPPTIGSGNAHDFGNGDIYQSVTLQPGNYVIVLQWQDSIYSIGQTATGSQNDLDIYLTDENGNALFGYNRNNNNGDPLEIFPFTVRELTQSNIMIVRANGTGNVDFKYVVFRGEMTINEHNTGSSTIVGHPNAEGAIAVGAVLYSNTPAYGVDPPTIASFSSRGGTLVNGQVRNKPEISAPNGVNTSVNLGGQDIEGDNFPNFFGTSAAAPHAAATAALIVSAQQKFEGNTPSPDSIKNILISTAIDMEGTGFDFESGHGLIQADFALQSFANPTPDIDRIWLTDSSKTAGVDSVIIVVQGNHFINGTYVFLDGDTLVTSYLSDTTIRANVPPFQGNPDITLFNTAITSSLLDGGYSDTISFFDIVKTEVRVIADDQGKFYSEKNPELTFHVLVDGKDPSFFEYTLEDLGLDSVHIYTTADSY